jgi:hypothetical protein
VATVRHRIVPLLAVSCALVPALATPAHAATLANERYKWFYWAGPLLAVGFLGFLVALALGYYVRVLRPKWRGRQSA